MTEERELDHIVAAGLRRMDEAVEGVIAKYAPEEGAAAKANSLRLTRMREYNQELLAMADAMALAAPKIWPTDDIHAVRGNALSGCTLRAGGWLI